MLNKKARVYFSCFMLILGTLIGFLLSKWSEIGSLGWREPDVITLTVRMPENGSLPSRMIYGKPDIAKAPRRDVMVLSPWLAPIVWAGTFNRDLLMEEFQHKKYRIGLTVTAIGKYVKLLKKFLESTERYFMKGGMVTYYVFTDRPDKVKALSLEVNRPLKIITVPKYPTWGHVVLGRMEILKNQSEVLFQQEVDYVVSLDVDMVLFSHIGVEILGELVSVIHPGYYHSPRKDLPYERRPASQAFIPEDEGDFYYQANFFVGTVQRIYQLATACYEGIVKDKANDIQAVVYEESHFNKYLVYNKPTKLLSPEYIWMNNLWRLKDIRIKRIVHGEKKF
ncbi:histo-blood group ABO system transferase 1 [Microcaecilia unicolor]|uniref:Histo-blood group ABO system transferase 1-like n=1 Tax=Microcaecilia unicolor TaxID=1415580 RepID=A0A6P7XJI1_9AMPH|nr:histo-blood group ABO system transferase 1-like [Microcaecilia unicolor]